MDKTETASCMMEVEKLYYQPVMLRGGKEAFYAHLEAFYAQLRPLCGEYPLVQDLMAVEHDEPVELFLARWRLVYNNIMDHADDGAEPHLTWLVADATLTMAEGRNRHEDATCIKLLGIFFLGPDAYAAA